MIPASGLPSLPGLTLFGKFMLFVTDAELCRKVLSHNDADTMLMVLHPSAKNILGEENIAFIHGPKHKALRCVCVCVCWGGRGGGGSSGCVSSPAASCDHAGALYEICMQIVGRTEHGPCGLRAQLA